MIARSFRIAGLHFTLECDPHALPTVARGWAAFEVPDTSSRRVRVTVDPERLAHRGPRTLPTLHAEGDRFECSGEDFRARLSADLDGIEITQPLDAYPTAAVLKLVLAADVLSRGGVVCHGVALAHAGQGAFFVGDSGAGKSTLGELARAGGLERLSDELAVLRRDEGGFVLEGTPWNIGRPGAVSLRCLGVLGWASTHSLQDVPAAEVLRTLATNTLLPREDPVTRRQVFSLLTEALEEARPVRLRFAREASVAEVLREALGGAGAID